MDCLDANAVQDLMSGALDSAERGNVLGHLDICEDCRQLVNVTARDTLRGHRAPSANEIALTETVASTPGRAMTDDALSETLAPDDPSAVRTGTGRVITARPVSGRLFGRYELLEKLGAGAMGVVWIAEDPELKRKLAVKLLRRPDASQTDRLLREAQSMARVNHPNVVGVYDVGVTDGAPYIAMELVRGESLRAWQNRTPRHTIPEVVAQYIAAGRGLAAAHARGIIHRDFKPDNVLVGEDGRARVTDFGLAAARAVDNVTASAAREISDVNLTTSGSVLGTPAYMAPEQFTGGNVDSRTDQFNFCVALYEALYGERPFEAKSFAQLADEVCAGKIRPAPAGTRVSRELRAILLRGMSAEPGDRFPSMDHLLAQLGRDRARPWRRVAIASAAIAAALVLGLISDLVVRGRVESQIRQSFAATGKQIERAGLLQAHEFKAASNLVRENDALRTMTAHHDQADFGLATPEQDAADLEQVRDTLFATDWRAMRELEDQPSELAIVDYKGRLMYTSAAPTEWKTQLDAMPAVKRALDGERPEMLAIVAYDDPAFAAAHLFGAHPPQGLAVMFARSLVHGGERGGAFLQFIDGKDVLAGIRLDETELGLVAPDGRAVGDVPAELAAAAPPNGDVGDVTIAGKAYQVQARPLVDFDGKPYATVVMARGMGGVLALFPHARAVFACAALAALALALATALRARQITGTRV
ncbi:MAG TPA: serine/threonine-protein kinase [Kofleriaceae bacterium]|nr:serine/threonine-protein kinase [Kofleriaceae bacterium]